MRSERTEEESDGVSDVSEDELEREMVDTKATANPGEKAVEGSDERQDGQHVTPAARAHSASRGLKRSNTGDVTHRI